MATDDAFNNPNPAPEQGSAPLVDVGQNVVRAINALVVKVGETFPNFVTAPSNCTASGVAGQVAYSGSATATSYFYICLTSGATGSGRWGRVQLTTTF